MDSVICTDNSSLLRQQLVVKKLENRLLRRQITAQQQEIKQLEARLKQYENPNTPPSTQGCPSEPTTRQPVLPVAVPELGRRRSAADSD